MSTPVTTGTFSLKRIYEGGARQMLGHPSMALREPEAA